MLSDVSLAKTRSSISWLLAPTKMLTEIIYVIYGIYVEVLDTIKILVKRFYTTLLWQCKTDCGNTCT